LTESAVRRFEAEHQITLPADYAAFLQMAGNGGAGPYYGLYPLDTNCSYMEFVWDEAQANEMMPRPCPLFPEMPREENWEEQFSDCASPLQGVIAIGHQGCTYMTGLIVSGEYRGRVIYFDENMQPPYVLHEPDFLSWYERWLDELLAGADLHSFGFGLGGDEPQLWKVFDDPATKERHRALAIEALRKWPQLSPEGQLRVCELLQHSNADVRTAACYAIEKFKLRSAVKQLVARLQDEAANVREAAVVALLDLDPQTYRIEACELLFDDDPHVAERAFFRLKGEKLPRETLLRLMQSQHGNLRGLAAHAFICKRGDEELLAGLLNDLQFNVRHSALLDLRQLKAATAIPAVLELLQREADHNLIDSSLYFLGEVPGEENAEVLLKWVKHADDFHRLAAFDSLCKLGDLRAKPIAQALLAETRTPQRRTLYSSMSNAKSIGQLARESLRTSPNAELRGLAGWTLWPRWLRLAW
jgi:HEAT repeat protein